jgi:hypothetical protein
MVVIFEASPPFEGGASPGFFPPVHSDAPPYTPERGPAPSAEHSVAPRAEHTRDVTRRDDPESARDSDPGAEKQARVNTPAVDPSDKPANLPPAAPITNAVAPQHGDLSSARMVATTTSTTAGAAELVDAADGTSHGAHALSDPTASPGGPTGDSTGARSTVAFAGGTVLATLTLPASTTFGTDAAVSPAVQGELPPGVVAAAADSLAMAARWAAQGLRGDASIELGAAAVQGSIPGRALDAMRFFMPAQVLGLAPGWATDASDEEQEGGNWGWKLTAVVSLAATLTGYWYCNKTADRRRHATPAGAPPRGYSPVQRARRVYPGSHPPGERELLAH